MQDASDPAIAVVERLRSIQAARDIDLVVDAKVHGSNRKVSNLVNMAPRIRHDVVVLADSDMRVDARLSVARHRGAAKRPASTR